MTICSVLLALSGLFSVVTAYVLVTDISSTYLSLTLVPAFLQEPLSRFYIAFFSESISFALPLLLGAAAIVLVIVNLWNSHVSRRLRVSFAAVTAALLAVLLTITSVAHDYENSILLRVFAVLCLLLLAVYAVLVVVNAVHTLAD